MNKSNIMHGIAGVLIVGIIFLYEYSMSQKLLNNHNYTIGEVYGFENGGSGGRIILYIFEIEGKTYKGRCPNGYNKKEMENLLHRNFFVIFNPDSPTLSGILLNKPINKDVYDIPPQGWTEKPPGCPDIK